MGVSSNARAAGIGPPLTLPRNPPGERPSASPHRHLPSTKQVGQTQRIHVPIWYILGPFRGSCMVALGLKYILYRYMDPLGKGVWVVATAALSLGRSPKTKQRKPHNRPVVSSLLCRSRTSAVSG